MDKVFTISEFLDGVNEGLTSYGGQLIGEVTSVVIRASAVYFNLKDSKENASLACFMWLRDLNMSGVELKEGLEVQVLGIPQIYKPTGRLNFQVKVVQLVGEGALKKAYLELKAKLEKEGVFDSKKKKEIPAYIKKIGVITSRDGAVIHDFLNNLGRYGYDTQLFNVHVEGLHALKDIRKALVHFAKTDVDVVVLIRGGGSLESFAAFNNEMLVREVSEYSKPLISGLGHDKDVPLVALASDLMTSTPTAVTSVINESWEQAAHLFENLKYELFRWGQDIISQKAEELYVYEKYLVEKSFAVRSYIQKIIDSVSEHFRLLKTKLDVQKQLLSQFERQIDAYDPRRVLKVGYSIVMSKEKVIKYISDVKKNDRIEIQVSDGSISAKVL